MKRTLAVVSAGVRLPSSTRLLADRLTGAARDELEELGSQVDIDVVEARDLAHDLVNCLMAGYPSPELRRAFDAVAGADGLIAVTPIFNASCSGLFKLFFDCIEDAALADKPVLIAATGGTGRHSLVLEHALRPMFTYLHAVAVPTAVYAATEDWGSGGGSQGPLLRRVARAARELAVGVHRSEPLTPADPYRDPVPFEQLLDGM
ncbi:FMN reductase [Streptomyces sp. NBC_00316]|uniref:FMN reductase n=1 Tax=Streptomyces sp. NBC_00316 TaxID=2975710 RepID=UPI002E2BE3FA|nr:FMN reductase [Streptomyces sp. NBC_00316]